MLGIMYVLQIIKLHKTAGFVNYVGLSGKQLDKDAFVYSQVRCGYIVGPNRARELSGVMKGSSQRKANELDKKGVGGVLTH